MYEFLLTDLGPDACCATELRLDIIAIRTADSGVYPKISRESDGYIMLSVSRGVLLRLLPLYEPLLEQCIFVHLDLKGRTQSDMRLNLCLHFVLKAYQVYLQSAGQQTIQTSVPVHVL